MVVTSYADIIRKPVRNVQMIAKLRTDEIKRSKIGAEEIFHGELFSRPKEKQL